MNRRNRKDHRSNIRNRSRLRVEVLEDRRLLAADVSHPFVPGEILLGLKGPVVDLYLARGNQSAVEASGAALKSYGLNSGEILQHVPARGRAAEQLTMRWHLPPTANVLEVIEAVSQYPNVEYAEPNYILTTALTSSPTFSDDPKLGDLWGMHNDGQTGGVVDADIDATEAWTRHRGSHNTVVGVIDTGVNYDHEDLAANIWVNHGEIEGNGIDDDGNGYVDDIHGWDFVNNDNDPMDDNKHGTHVAGTIGAVGNNGTGVAGVNWEVQIMPLKFLDNRGSGTTEDAIRAIEYATMMRQLYESSGGTLGANIVLTNNSWGGGAASNALSNAIAASGDANMLFVASAGNSGGGAGYPALYPHENIISVAATDHADQLASFSSRGAGVDLAAPGVDILSTMRNRYGQLSGTSMASPHVAGVAALSWDLLAQEGHDPGYAEVRDLIFSSVDTLPSLAGHTVTGGRLNANQALIMADQLLGRGTVVAIEDTSVVEGDGTTTMDFAIQRQGDLDKQTTVSWETLPIDADPSSDYVTASGEVSFAAGDATATIQVTVTGDSVAEPHEQFTIRLIEADTAFILDSEATITILNDDTTLAITDASVVEGDDSIRVLDRFIPHDRAGMDYALNLEYGPDSDGNGRPDHLFVTSWLDRNVLKFDAETGTQGQVFLESGAGGLNSPNDLRFGPDGNLYVSDSNGHAIFRYDPLTGEPRPAPGKPGAVFVDAGDGGLNGPRGLTFDSAGDLYVSSYNTDEVLRFEGPTGTTPGTFIGAFVTAASAGLDAPRHLDFHDGHLYVNSYLTGSVLRFNAIDGTPAPAEGKTGADFVTSGSGGLEFPFGLEFFDPDSDGSQDLFIASRNGTNVLRFDGSSGNLVEEYASLASETSDLSDLMFTPDGNLLAASGSANQGVLRLGPASQTVFTVSLLAPVGQPVQVIAATADGDALASDQDYVPTTRTITFGPNETTTSFLVKVLDDVSPEADETFTVGLTTLSGTDAPDLRGVGTIVDDDRPGITVTPSSGLVTSESGQSDTFSVVLDTPPTHDVTIGIQVSDFSEGSVDVTTATFTPLNWNLPQVVRVTGSDDVEADGDVPYLVLITPATSEDDAYNGLDANDVSVVNLDDDSAATLTIGSISPDSASPGESVSVSINGSGFQVGASVMLSGGSGPSPNVSNISVSADGLLLTATINLHRKAKAESWDVVVANPDGSTVTCPACFFVVATTSGAVPPAITELANMTAVNDTASRDEDLQNFAVEPITNLRSGSNDMAAPSTASESGWSESRSLIDSGSPTASIEARDLALVQLEPEVSLLSDLWLD